jgi:hypothetical protein
MIFAHRRAERENDLLQGHESVQKISPRFRATDCPIAIAQTEIDCLGNCPVCCAPIDVSDLAQVLAHIHDAEIEIRQGSGPLKRGEPLH